MFPDEINLDEIEINTEDLPEFDAREYINQCVILLHLCCDGATSDDAMGFAGMHTHYGKTLGSKLQEGYHFSEKDLNWCKKSLPYYLNTQLAHIDKELFYQCIEDLIPDAQARDKIFSEARKAIINLPKARLKDMFLQEIKEESVPKKFKQPFINMKVFMQARGFLTPKQLNFAAVIVRETMIQAAHKEVYYPT